MKISRIAFLFLLLSLFVPSASYGKSAADKAWKPFWKKFSAAVKKKNKVVLKRLMSESFIGNDDPQGDPRDDWFNNAKDDSDFWQKHQDAIAKGTVSCGKTCRTTGEEQGLVFEFKNKRWLWTSVSGGFGKKTVGD